MVRAALRAMLVPPPVRWLLVGLARCGLLPGGVWRRLPVNRTFKLRTPHGGAFAYHGYPADHIGRYLYWRGLAAYEPETLSVWYELSRRAAFVIDVGANTGAYTLLALAANPHLRMVVFEPVRSVRAVLLENLGLNNWLGRCQVRTEAVSDSPGTVQFHVPEAKLPTSASMNPQGFRGLTGRLEEVPLTTVDLCVPAGQRVDLVKIDVEGFEDRVLRGMTRTLREDGPSLIVECNPDGPTTAIEDVLREFGYRFFALRAAGPQRMEHIVPDATLQFRNYLCGVNDDWRQIGRRAAHDA